MKYFFLVFFLFVLQENSFSQENIDFERTKDFPKTIEKVRDIPKKENIWAFIMAGQSNMAGRGQVEPSDTIPNNRILTINPLGEIVYAKEPLHLYEPTRTGLDCGMAFSKILLENIPKNISILIIPTAIGGSSITQWLGDSLYREVKLLSNFKEKAAIAQKYGIIKGILWHQGESDAIASRIPNHDKNLVDLFSNFRKITGNLTLPIMIGELGSYSKTNEDWQKINQKLKEYTSIDQHSAIIQTQDFKHKGDDIHFNSEGQRMMGERFALTFLQKFNK
ncbi:Carbohydrate acetyl esterase/feruloyl esterase [Emticicia aquatica]|uniref:Carbohydrate acetyl esterase/feruloyl esterase n=1 Tax=Emticicia aquatica TaxID=1681835 RepID=A0ABN8ER97_9BACT|nr:sialate O-acetylesterase [Emticicia aquatica]CAH0994009.1 Carbohydrate acetyl esterase/feruloyl esterase [Emticicia aquatica]